MNRGGFFLQNTKSQIETRPPLKNPSRKVGRLDIFHPSGLVQRNELFANAFRHGNNMPETGIYVPPHKEARFKFQVAGSKFQVASSKFQNSKVGKFVTFFLKLAT